MGYKIKLPYGGKKGASFDTDDLVAHIRASGRDYIIQGQQAVSLAKHTKMRSLDVWLRLGYTDMKDTKQADNEVIRQLVKTGLFRVGRFVCPESGRLSNGIQVVDR